MGIPGAGLIGDIVRKLLGGGGPSGKGLPNPRETPGWQNGKGAPGYTSVQDPGFGAPNLQGMGGMPSGGFPGGVSVPNIGGMTGPNRNGMPGGNPWGGGGGDGGFLEQMLTPDMIMQILGGAGDAWSQHQDRGVQRDILEERKREMDLDEAYRRRGEGGVQRSRERMSAYQPR